MTPKDLEQWRSQIEEAIAIEVKMASGFEEQWYRTGAALEGIGFLLAAFMMIPTLSCYSCLLKAEGCAQFRENSEAEGAERGSFFGVPEDIQNHS